MEMNVIRWLAWSVLGVFVVIFWLMFQMMDSMSALEDRMIKLEDAQSQILTMLSSIRFED